MTTVGWLGLLLVVASVAAGYVGEAVNTTQPPERQYDPPVQER